MIVLSIDSSTECASCAVLEDNKLLGEINFNNKKQHSVILMPMVDSLLKNLQLNISEIDGFVISKGPGSFTGLRIGMAMIKGLSQGTKKPFVAVSSLDALAFNLAYSEGIICPILDALRGNVYTAFYAFEAGVLKRFSDYMTISIEELIDKLKEYNSPISFVGDGTYKFRENLQSSISNVRFAPAHLNLARAAALGELGLKLMAAGHFDDLYTSAPLYLRKPQAEREYEKKTGMSIND